MAKKRKGSDLPKVHKPKSWQSDLLGVLVFVVIVAVGVFVINVAVFRSYSVTGPSMEPTFYTKDRIIVNRLPVTWAMLQGKQYVPTRGQIIVFENPLYKSGEEDKFIVKRVIGFPGEHIKIQDCAISIYNNEHKNGFDPYDDFDIKPVCVSGDIDQVVDDNALFVIGDNRDGRYSLDSRSGLGQVPYDKVVGPVGVQIYPFDKIQLY
jgi:signal peptidase I